MLTEQEREMIANALERISQENKTQASNLDNRIANIETNISSIDSRMSNIEVKLDAVIERFDKQLDYQDKRLSASETKINFQNNLLLTTVAIFCGSLSLLIGTVAAAIIKDQFF